MASEREAPAITVEGLTKTFRMRTQSGTTPRKVRVRPTSFKAERRTVLDGISFDVRQGEVFGIVGRNGSGKSTLLKILASIYGYDSGSIRVNGRIAPFVDLGVGFHPELSAWDNVCTNAVMMGLTPDEARERYDAIIEFAELQGFAGLELKNYSSGMRMRLAFATLMQVDAEIMVIDEILGVGDARFRQKCGDAFARHREQGHTVILVSHSLSQIKHCDRAMLLHEGKVDSIGHPDEVTSRHLELQRVKPATSTSKPAPVVPRADGEPTQRIAAGWVQDSVGRVVARVPMGERVRIHALVESEDHVVDPALVCEVRDDHGQEVSFRAIKRIGGEGGRLRPGESFHVTVPIGDELAPGTYLASVQLRGRRGKRTLMLTEPRLVTFAVSQTGRPMPAALDPGVRSEAEVAA